MVTIKGVNIVLTVFKLVECFGDMAKLCIVQALGLKLAIDFKQNQTNTFFCWFLSSFKTCYNTQNGLIYFFMHCPES